MRKLLWLALSTLVSGCVTVPNWNNCSAAGSLEYGMICAETLTGKTSELNLAQTIDFLQAQSERPDPDHPGAIFPARGAAICQSSSDYQKITTVLEQMCTELGNRCSYEAKQAILAAKAFGAK